MIPEQEDAPCDDQPGAGSRRHFLWGASAGLVVAASGLGIPGSLAQDTPRGVAEGEHGGRRGKNRRGRDKDRNDNKKDKKDNKDNDGDQRGKEARPQTPIRDWLLVRLRNETDVTVTYEFWYEGSDGPVQARPPRPLAPNAAVEGASLEEYIWIHLRWPESGGDFRVNGNARNGDQIVASLEYPSRSYQPIARLAPNDTVAWTLDSQAVPVGKSWLISATRTEDFDDQTPFEVVLRPS